MYILDIFLDILLSDQWLITAINPRNRNSDDVIIFDELLYKQRYTIQRTNAWVDSYRTLLNRFETKTAKWKAFNYMIFISYSLTKLIKEKSQDDLIVYSDS